MDHEELKRRLLKTFRTEAVEHLKTIASGLLEIEKRSSGENYSKSIEEIYRAAHSLKGASRAVNLHEIEMICQALESCFAKIKAGTVHPSADQFDQFHTALEKIKMFMDPEAKDKEGYRDLISQLNDIADFRTGNIVNERVSDNTADDLPGEEDNIMFEEGAGKSSEMGNKSGNEQISNTDPVQAEEQEAMEENIRIPLTKINDLFLRSEETLQIKLAHQQEYEQVEELRNDLRDLRSNWSALSHELQKFRQSMEGISNPNDRVGSLFFTKYEETDQLVSSILDKHKSLQNTSRYVERSTHTILDALTGEFKQILIFPLSELFSGFPILVRELSKDLGKRIEFEMSGTNLEVDRRIMEKLKDPLIHLLRNSIDHGIESPESRKVSGKPANGRIAVSVDMVDALSIRIQIEDDGKGVDPDEIRKVAGERGIMKRETSEKLSDEDALQLLFRSGFSTSEIITDISGRGLGMAIVKEHVIQLGGRISFTSETGKGSKVVIEVPTRLSNARGLVVHSGGQVFVLPVQGVRETVRLAVENLKTVNKRETIMHPAGNIPIVPLTDLMDLTTSKRDKALKLTVIIIENLGERIGIVVDEVSGEQEILFKSFGFPLKKVRNVSGVCLSGTGKIITVLDTADLVSEGLKGKSVSSKMEETEDSTEKKRSILIAEDSITSRMFLKNILEGAGFSVKATVDGKEAWTELMQNSYDILVTDIEMPRMTGLELTEKVKNDPERKSMPVILITSLSSREDRERGIDAGADAYIMKSTFDQSNLIEVVSRFI